MSPKSALYTRRPLTLPNSPSGSSSLLMASLVLPNLRASHNPAQGSSRLTTLSIWPSRYSTRMTPNSQGPCTSLPQESVPSLEYAVRLSCVKSITLLTSQLILAREQTPSSACSITSSKYMGMGLESRTSTSMLTTVGVKIRTTPCHGRVGYLLWCVLTGVHQNITLSFMITGHTKFSPDWCFGLMRKR